MRAEEVASRAHAEALARARLEEARAELARIKAGAWKSELGVANARVDAEVAHVKKVETDLERLVTRAPFTGEVLQLKVRPGEMASATPATPLLVLGNTTLLHVRASVDEHEAHRVTEDARAEAVLRGDATRRAPMKFVRFEPYVIPKSALSGAVAERVDTRVLEVVYALERDALPLRVGQQVDVFMEASQSP
jgi:multidrug resistance efflux pump